MRIIYCIVLFAVCLSQGKGQSPLLKQWDARFGGLNADGFNAFQQTSDNGFILGGNSNSNIGGDKTEPSRGGSDYWIVKIDSLGNKQWDKVFGGTDEDYLFALYQTFDGGYILGGTSRSDSGGDKSEPTFGIDDFWIVKIDSIGNKQWDKDFGGNDFEILFSIIQTRDGGFIFGGLTFSDSSGNKTEPLVGGFGDQDYWIIKTDSLGNKLWEKDFGGTDWDNLSTIKQTLDAGFLLAGTSNSGIGGHKTKASKGMSDYWIIKIDSIGNIEWDKVYGGDKDDALYSFEGTSNHGYILHGTSKSNISGDKTENNWDPTGTTNDLWLIKIDSFGNMEWDKDYGGFDGENNPGNISRTKDDGYFVSCPSLSNISGDKSQNNLGFSQTWTLKLDSLGNKQWDKTVFTLGSNALDNLSTQTRDGCYVIACDDNSAMGGDKSVNSWNNSYDYWIIKYCDTSSTGISSQFQPVINLYPVPTTGNLKVNSPNRILNFKIFDLFGVLKLELMKVEDEVDISLLTPGCYFVKIETNIGNYCQKLIKQ